MRAIEDILAIDILARQIVRQVERDFGFNPQEPRDESGKWTAEGIKNHLMTRPGDKLADIAKGLGAKKFRGLAWEDHPIGKTLAGMVDSGHVERKGEGYRMAARQPSGPYGQPQSQHPWQMTPEQFYKKYRYQHTLLANDSDATKDSIESGGFRKGIGPNVVGITERAPSDIMEKKYGTKSGKFTYAIPSHAVKSGGNGNQISEGHKPTPHEGFRAARDFEPVHEGLVRSAIEKGHPVPEHVASRYPHLKKTTSASPSNLPHDFPARATAAARAVAARGGHGTSNLKDKATIASSHKEYERTHGPLPLEHFKQGLLKHQGNGINLVPEDRIMQGFDPAMQQDLQNSETARGTSKYHWILADHPSGEAKPAAQSVGMSPVAPPSKWSSPIVDPGRQMGLFARDKSGQPADIGSSAGQADLFSRAKYAQEGPPKESPIQRQFDPRHTGGLFGPMESMPEKKKKSPPPNDPGGGMLFSADFAAEMQDFKKWMLEFEKEITRP